MCETKNPPRFPMFVNLTGIRAVVVGGGPVAARRANVLAGFGAQVTVISPEIDESLEPPFRILRRPYAPGDLSGFALALAATNSRETNHAVFLEAQALHIPVNVSDAPEECGFYFPAIARRGPLVVGITASGTDHGLAKETARRIRERLEELAAGKEAADAKA